MSIQAATQTNTYSIDPAHSTVRFWVRHMMIAKVHGELHDVTGTVKFDSTQPELAEIDVNVNVASLSTNNEQRDAHLKSPDFLNVEANPTITFRSMRIRKTGENQFEVEGDLTLNGITSPVTLNAEITEEVKSHFGGYKIGVSATGKIDREDFNMTWNQALEAGGVLVGKEVNLQIDVELDRPE